VMEGGGGDATSSTVGGSTGAVSNVTAFAGSGARGELAGATALKAEPEQKLSPTEKLEGPTKLGFTRPESWTSANIAALRAEAKAKGYVGEACTECGNFSLVRNGTCLKCDTCGSTTGCS
jgi:ribonucleoside-diphosphate reductase alpha chain